MVNYGDLECSPHMIARQEREADAKLNAAAAANAGAGHEDMEREAQIWAEEMKELDN